MNEYYTALIGGGIIGISTSIMLVFKGRIFGVSGILAGLVKPSSGNFMWQATIFLGLILGGAVSFYFLPKSFPKFEIHPLKAILAGLLVGFGTQLGSGCTSGHGICGMSRLSPRSIVATLTFIISGILTVGLMNCLRGQ